MHHLPRCHRGIRRLSHLLRLIDQAATAAQNAQPDIFVTANNLRYSTFNPPWKAEDDDALHQACLNNGYDHLFTDEPAEKAADRLGPYYGQ